MKKKGLIITISVLLILFVASLITKYIDTANVSTGHEPECCIKIVSQDGNKVTYWGLGYKVVRYVGVSPNEPYKNNIGVKMGSWFMKYENPTNVVLDVKSFGTDNIFQISDNLICNNANRWIVCHTTNKDNTIRFLEKQEEINE